ncbi:UNVERIFIED_CONTAM: Cilia- and flagella-associated protein 47 [Siphonaria sp. JEL0065]|nr:Cilia- and flagella-associated protein 47 [Siphonaria sp. JEL0065]
MKEPLAIARDLMGGVTTHAKMVSDRFGTSPPEKNISFRIKNLKASGTRTTIFTNISSVSVQSLEAAAKKKCLDNYFKVRAEPPEINIVEYELGKKVTQTLSIKNFSAAVRQIVLMPLVSKYFKLAKDTPLSGITIAPGLSTEISIEVLVDSSKSDTNCFSHVLEFAVKEVHQPDFRIQVPISVALAGPKLVYDKSVDFGIMVVGNNYHMDPTDAISQKFISIRNLGSRGTTFVLDYNRSIMRVYPEKVTLGPKASARKGTSTYEDDECPIKIEFLRCPVGDKQEKIIIKNLEGNEYEPINVAASIVDHKLRLRNSDNSGDLDPQSLDFGIIYYSQIAQFTSKLENRGLKPLRWVITHAGDSVPIVPDGLLQTMNKRTPEKPGLPTIEDLLKQDIMNQDSQAQTAMTVFPLEGSLDQNESCDITFTFSPKTSTAATGFKTKAVEPSVNSYRVPMQLRILKKEGSSNSEDGEEPIDLLLMGKACPIQTNISTKEITFPFIQDSGEKGESREAEVSLKNLSPLLGISYSFQALAQFHAFPPKGKLQPGESKSIKVLFKPSQLGRFEKVMDIFISALDKSPKQNPYVGVATRKPSVYFVKFEPGVSAESAIQTIKLRLRGALTPGKISPAAECEPKDKASLWRSNIQVNNKKVNEEWEDKIENRTKYLDYLKNSRTQRLIEKRAQRIGNDGVKVPYNILQAEDPKLDRENGLIPPEPDDFIGVARAQSASFGLAEDHQRVKTLLNQLMEPKLYEVADIESSIGDMESYLTAEDLSNIFAAKTCIDFGIVTAHSTNIQPLNFLNLRKTPAHISIQTVSDGIQIKPSNLLLDAFSVSGFSATFKSDSVGSFNGKITYLVNGRYKYQIFTKAEVRPVQLELSTKSVHIEILTGLANDPTEPQYVNSDIVENKVLHQAQQTIQIFNRGNYPTSFEWSVDGSQNYTSSGIAIEGGFEVEPMTGTIDSNGMAEVSIIYTAGIRCSSDKTLVMKVVDSETQAICDSINIRCHGEIPSATCVLLTSTKQGPLDLGICPVGFSKFDKRYPLNALASHLLIPGETPIPHHQTARSFVRDSSWARGYRTIKIKNTSAKSCFYSAQVLSNNSDVILSAPTGVILGNGGTTELHVIATPTSCGEFHDEVHICIIGGGRVLKVPFKYEGKKPQVIMLAKNFGDLSLGTILGTSAKINFDLVNDYDVGTRAVVDFRLLKELKFSVIGTTSLVKTPSSRATSPSRAVSPGEKRSKPRNIETSSPSQSTKLRIYSSIDEIFKFDSVPGRRLSMVKKRKESIHPEKAKFDHDGKLYVFDIHPFEAVSCSVEFTPTSEKHFQMSLPIS